jgi:CheY-like chemotaxis protein
MKGEQAQEGEKELHCMTEPEKVSPASSLVLNGRRILVVESHPDNAFIWTTLLEEAGAEVIQANKASVALVALEGERLDLIISNIYLEDEDGFSLIRKIRGHESKGDKQIPAIAVESAWNPDVSSTTVKEAGFQLFMSRPIDIDEVIRAIVSLTE